MPFVRCHVTPHNEDVISAEPFAPSISGSDDKMSEKEKGAEHVDGVRIQVEEEKGDTLVDVHTHLCISALLNQCKPAS